MGKSFLTQFPTPLALDVAENVVDLHEGGVAAPGEPDEPGPDRAGAAGPASRHAPAGRPKPCRARSAAARTTQPRAWSLTKPMACINAYTVVGPTKAQP